MHPAISVIFFTVMSGAGYGLAFFLSLQFLSPAQAKLAWVVALVLIAMGLCSSLFHLGNPQRAWRAFSQWRSSWLSREGCMAIVTFIPLASLTTLSIFYEVDNLFIGVSGAIFCLATIYCTAMIYASIRAVAQWHTYLTPINYFACAMSSGALLLFVFTKNQTVTYLLFCLSTILFTGLIKFMWHRRAGKILYGDSNIETATGLGKFGKVRLLEPPHTQANYLTNEMVYRLGQKHEKILLKLTWGFILILPIASIFYSPLLAWVFHMFGIFIERYLFFALARHAVSLYYGKED